MKNFFLVIVSIFLFGVTNGQKKDTVIVNLAKTSKIIFTIEDPEDLEILKHYDFQKLFEDVLHKVEERKAVAQRKDSTTNSTADDDSKVNVIIEKDEPAVEREVVTTKDDDDSRDDGNYGHYESDDDDDNNHDHDWYHDHDHHGKWHRTWQAFNFDIGMNNYLEDKKFPSTSDAYAVRPWGSWYLGIASVQRSRLAKKFFLEWGLGVNWYAFKFEHDNTVIEVGEDGVVFSLDERDLDYEKSKLSMSFVQASLIPVLDFGDQGRKRRFWDGYNNRAFRIGFGPYIAYRIQSHSKVKYDTDGREIDKKYDGFFLNNFRYGTRLQVGYRSTDLFFNYDLNELFEENKGPKLNAFSFGVIF